MRIMSVVREVCEGTGVAITHGCRCFIVFVDASANASPEGNKDPNEEDQAKGKAACSQSYSPHSRHERVGGKNLVRCASVVSEPKAQG